MTSDSRQVSPEWQRDCKRNGAGITTLFVVAALAWLTGSHTLIPLSNGKVIHPSWLGWPLYLCVAGIALGAYVYEAATHEKLWIPGRRYTPVDHSFRYSLWFDEFNPHIGIGVDGSEPGHLSATVGISFTNGGTAGPISVHMEKLQVTINGLAPLPNVFLSPDFRLLPDRSRRMSSATVNRIPPGPFNGELEYSVTYGPPIGFPVYRKTQRIRFQTSRPVTLEGAKDDLTGLSVSYSVIEPEIDIDI
jgi:hypothetical protein